MTVGLNARRTGASGRAVQDRPPHHADQDPPAPPRRAGSRSIRRTATLALCALAALSAATGAPRHTPNAIVPATTITPTDLGPADISPAADATVTQLTVPQVVAAMNVARNPVAYVILVDVSGSMASGGLFNSVQNALPDLVSAMNPDDTVAVDTFGNSAQQISAPAPVGDKAAADAVFKQLSVEPNGDTDTGSGLLLAYNQLYAQAPHAKIGVVLLLTDGKPDIPVGQSPYALADVNTNSSAATDTAAIDSSPQWQGLHKDFSSLTTNDGMTVIGGGVTLRPGLDLAPIVNGVFSNAYIDTNPDMSTLLTFIQGAQQQVQTADAAKLLSADNGAGITATLSGAGLSGAGLSTNGVNLANGSSDATLTLSTSDKYAPLVLSNAALTTTSGMPVTVSGLPATIAVPPGAQVKLPVVLHWQTPNPKSPLASPVTRSSTLILSGQVGSPWSTAITSMTGKTFAPSQQISGSARLAGSEPGQVETVLWLVLAIILLLLAAGWYAYRTALYPNLHGVLDIRIGVADHEPVVLPRRRRYKIGNVTVADQTARFTVRSARRFRGTRPLSSAEGPATITVTCKTFGPGGTREKRKIESGASRHLCNSWKVHYLSDSPSPKTP
jgi:Mg-chelatase subunit ChlD